MMVVTEQVLITPVIDPNQSETISLSGVKGGDVEIDIPKIPSDTPIYPSVTVVSTSDLPISFIARDDIDTVLSITVEDANGTPIIDFADYPLTIRIPFESGSLNPPDTVALVDSAGHPEFLNTTVVGNVLQAQVTHLSYVLTLRNSQPIVASPIVDEPVDVPIEEDAADKLIDLSGVFGDVDIEYGVQLILAVMVESPDTGEGDGLSSAAEVLPLLGATIEGTALKLSFEPDQNGTATVKVTATDIQGSFVSDEFSVTVTPVNDDPVANLELEDLVFEAEEDGPEVIVDLSQAFTDVDIALSLIHI